MTRAIVIGSEGQDGQLLFERLKGEGASVLGIGRQSIRGDDAADLSTPDVTSREQVIDFIARWRPDEVYYLAAVHQASQDPTANDDAALFDRSVNRRARRLCGSFLGCDRSQRPSRPRR